MKINTTPITDAMSEINFSGNVVPPSWYKHIRYKTKRGEYTDHLAINLLAEIAYWYKNKTIKDEQTMEVIEITKRFNSDVWQISYDAIEKKFGCSRKQAKSAVDLLIELQLVSKIFRDIYHGDTVAFRNIMYLIPNPEMVRNITYNTKEIKKKANGTAEMGGTYCPNGRDVLPKSEPRIAEMGKITETSSETSSDISTESKNSIHNETIHIVDSDESTPPVKNGNHEIKPPSRNGEINGTCKTNAEKVSWVINLLNQTAGTNYRASTSATQKLVLARIKEGFNAADFYEVIKFKCREWKKDSEMSQFIRPITLFGNKFESYLNAAKMNKPAAKYNSGYTNGAVQNISYGEEYHEEYES